LQRQTAAAPLRTDHKVARSRPCPDLWYPLAVSMLRQSTLVDLSNVLHFFGTTVASQRRAGTACRRRVTDTPSPPTKVAGKAVSDLEAKPRLHPLGRRWYRVENSASRHCDALFLQLANRAKPDIYLLTGSALWLGCKISFCIRQLRSSAA
jgi:hypothetical protein